MKEDRTKFVIKFLTDQGIYIALIGLFVYFCFTPGFVFKEMSGDVLSGHAAAQGILEAVGKGGRIAIVQKLGSNASLQRVQGFKEKANELGLEIVLPPVNGNGETQKVKEATRKFLDEHPDVEAIFIVEKDIATGPRAALTASGMQLNVVIATPQKDRKVIDLKNITKIQQQIAFIVMIAVGMTFVITTAGIDISVGCVVALAAVILAQLIEKDWPIPICILVALTASVGCGGFAGFSITRFKVPPFIATVAMMTIVRGLARLLAENTKIFISKDVAVYTQIASTGSIFYTPIIVFIMFGVLAIFHTVYTKTQFGRYVLAVGGNPEAAKLSGINVSKILVWVYIINAFLSGVVGCLMAFKYTNGNPEFGIMWELDAIAAVVVGGTSLRGGKGSVFRTFIGALLIGILDNGLLLKGFSSELIYIIKGLVILGAVLLDQLKSR